MRHAMYLSCSNFFYSISASDTSFWIDDTLFLKIAAGILHFTHIVDTSRFRVITHQKVIFVKVSQLIECSPTQNRLVSAKKFHFRARRVKMRKYADLGQICELWLSIMEIANVDINFISRTRRVHAPRQKFKNPQNSIKLGNLRKLIILKSVVSLVRTWDQARAQHATRQRISTLVHEDKFLGLGVVGTRIEGITSFGYIFITSMIEYPTHPNFIWIDSFWYFCRVACTRFVWVKLSIWHGDR